jgi:hypothetical protein
MDVSHGSLVVCYDPSVPQWLKSNFNQMYISSWEPFLRKPVFNGEF